MNSLKRRLFATANQKLPARRPISDGSLVHPELRRQGVTLALLWQEYKAAVPDRRSVSATASGPKSAIWSCGKVTEPAKRLPAYVQILINSQRGDAEKNAYREKSG